MDWSKAVINPNENEPLNTVTIETAQVINTIIIGKNVCICLSLKRKSAIQQYCLMNGKGKKSSKRSDQHLPISNYNISFLKWEIKSNFL